MDNIDNEPKRPVHYLDGLEPLALMSPPAWNFVVNRMVDFARHYTEVMRLRENGETVEAAEKRLFGVEITVIK